MMTSSNGSIFRDNGPLCGEKKSPVTGEFPSQRPVNNRKPDDLRRHLVHYDVTVMIFAEELSVAERSFLAVASVSLVAHYRVPDGT